MRHYDAYGRRVPTSRYDKRPSEVGTMLLVLLVIAAVAVCGYYAYLATKGFCERPVKEPRPLCETITTTSAIKWYVMTDPTTKVQYLVNDRGGVVLREGTGNE